MNKRIRDKLKKSLLLDLLAASVSVLDMELTGYRGIYRARLKNPSSYEGVTVHRDGNIQVEIREKEQCHGRPHFHIRVRGGGDASYALDNFEKLAGEINPKIEKTIMIWACKNRTLLQETWNTFHGRIIQVS